MHCGAAQIQCAMTCHSPSALRRLGSAIAVPHCKGPVHTWVDPTRTGRAAFTASGIERLRLGAVGTSARTRRTISAIGIFQLQCRSVRRAVQTGLRRVRGPRDIRTVQASQLVEVGLCTTTAQRCVTTEETPPSPLLPVIGWMIPLRTVHIVSLARYGIVACVVTDSLPS